MVINNQIKFLMKSLVALSLSYTVSIHSFIKEFGLGDQGVAYPQSATCARYNPAGIIDVGNQIVGGGGAIYLNGRVEIKDSELTFINQKASTTQCKWIPAGIFGLSKQLTPCISVAFSTDAGITSAKGTVSGGLNALGKKPLGEETIIALLVPSIACKLGRHNFGLSLPFQLSRIKSEGFQNSIPFSLYPRSVTNRGYDWAQGVNLKLGWIYHVNSEFTVGACYFSPLIITSRYSRYRGAIPYAGKFQSAPEYIIGAAYRFPRGALTFEGSCINFPYSKVFSNPVTSTAPLGSPNGPGAGFKNVWSIQIGGDFQLTDVTKIRGGYSVLFTPFIRKKNVLGNFLAPNLFVRHGLAAGFSQRFNQSFGLFDIDFGLLYALKRTVSTGNIPQLFGGNMRASGTSLTTLCGMTYYY